MKEILTEFMDYERYGIAYSYIGIEGERFYRELYGVKMSENIIICERTPSLFTYFIKDYELKPQLYTIRRSQTG